MNSSLSRYWVMPVTLRKSLLFLLLVLPFLSGCGVNKIPTYDEQAKTAWAQVENQYQRRAVSSVLSSGSGEKRVTQQTGRAAGLSQPPVIVITDRRNNNEELIA